MKPDSGLRVNICGNIQQAVESEWQHSVGRCGLKLLQKDNSNECMWVTFGLCFKDVLLFVATTPPSLLQPESTYSRIKLDYENEYT